MSTPDSVCANWTDAGIMKLDAHGWLLPGAGIALVPSPNFDARPQDADISLLVVHNISLPPGEFLNGYARDLFLNRLDTAAHPWFVNIIGLRVSAHFLIDRHGDIDQFVACGQRAWHAGVSSFAGRERCNDFSIGVELEGTDDVPFTDAQYDRLAELTGCLRARDPLRAVRGHNHVAPTRKTDPGPCFDWNRYARMAAWPSAALPDDVA